MRTALSLLGCWLLLLAAGSTAVARPSGGRPLVDATGVRFRARAAPDRIISLAPSLTEEVFALGDGNALVGDTIYCRHPAAAQTKTKIGTMLTPDLELIVRLQSDLILATKEGNRMATVAQLRHLGLRVYVVGDSRNFEGIARQFRALARLLHRESAGNAVLELANADIDSVQARVAKLPAVTVLFQVQAIPLVSVSRGSFINAILHDAGGRNIAADAPGRYPRLSREAVLAADPAVILVSQEQMGPDVSIQNWLGLGRLTAARARQVFPVPSYLFDTPTPMTFAAAVQMAARLLHPGER